MEIYQTEEQQVEAIKGYWAKNGNNIIAGIVLGFAGFIGFNLYQDDKLAQELAVADSYQALVEQGAENADEFAQNAEKFIAENADTSYVSLTALALAKEAAEKQDWETVQTQLNTAIKAAPTPSIKAIASLRLARVQVQLEQFDVALATLNGEFPASFIAAIEEVKGDLYLQQGNKDLARNAYQAAIAADGIATSPNLQVKLDDLAEVTILPSVVPAASAVEESVEVEEKVAAVAPTEEK